MEQPARVRRLPRTKFAVNCGNADVTVSNDDISATSTMMRELSSCEYVSNPIAATMEAMTYQDWMMMLVSHNILRRPVNYTPIISYIHQDSFFFSHLEIQYLKGFLKRYKTPRCSS